MSHITRNSRLRGRIVIAASVGILCTLLAACAPDAPMPVPSATPSATPIPQGDGVLTLGTLFPTTGSSAALARALSAGVELAVREINEAGGVNGKPVVVYHQNSGDASTTQPEEAFADLVSRDVDVLIGPATADLAERLLPLARSAGMAIIAPSIGSPTLTTLDDDGLLFRTSASESLQGRALADVIGKSRVALVYSLDDDARAIKAEFETGLTEAGGELVTNEGFSATTGNVDRLLNMIIAANPDTVVLANSSSALNKNKAIIPGLAQAGFAGSALWLTDQSLVDYSALLPPGTLENVNGIRAGAAPDSEFQKRVKSADPTVSSFRFAAEAYDATILAALAAVVAGNDSGTAISLSLQEVSAGGIACESFGECLDVLTSRSDIDYSGVSGPVDFDHHGDISSAPYGVYRYGADNKYTLLETTTTE